MISSLNRNLDASIVLNGETSQKFNYTYNSGGQLKKAELYINGNTAKNYSVITGYQPAGRLKSKQSTVFSSQTLFARSSENNYKLEYYYSNSKHQVDSIVNHTTGDATYYSFNSSGSIERIRGEFQSEFVWNTDQWLSAVENEYGIHHYVYNSKGERIMKSTLTETIVSINDIEENRSSYLEPYKVYVNPYYIEHEFKDVVKQTKHYYMGSQRVASQVGYLGPRDVGVEFPNDPVFSNLRQVRSEIKERTENTPLGQVTIEPNPWNILFELEEVFDESPAELTVPEDLRPRILYWYHPDYIGNVDLITDQTGTPYQFFMYNPWGENLYEYDAGTGDYDSPYRFNGKELDPETGNYYYGARYYDPKISVWLSVDPLSHKSPNQTPYHFVSNNPVMRIDPDGLHDYSLNKETGEITLIRPTEHDFDQLFATNVDGEIDVTNMTVIEDQSLLPQFLGEENTFYENPDRQIDIDGHTGNTTNQADAEELFNFSAENSNVEWSLQDYTDGSSSVSTANEDAITTSGRHFTLNGSKVVSRDIHSHPGTSRDALEPSERDIARARPFYKQNPNVIVQIYMPDNPNLNARVFEVTGFKWKSSYRIR